MAFRAMLLVFRKPDISPEAFKKHYEERHVPLLKSLAGDAFPKHIRNYVQRSSSSEETGTHGPTFPASVIFGTQEDFTYDCLTICEWPSQAIFQAFRAKIMEKEAAEKISADEAEFLDKSKPQQVVLMDETVVSGPGA